MILITAWILFRGPNNRSTGPVLVPGHVCGANIINFVKCTSNAYPVICDSVLQSGMRNGFWVHPIWMPFIALDQIAGQNNRIVLDDWIRTALNLHSLYLCSIYCNVNPDSKQIRLAMDYPVVTRLLYLLPGLRVPELHPTGPPGLESTWTKDHTTDWKCPYYEQQGWWAEKTLPFLN